MHRAGDITLAGSPEWPPHLQPQPSPSGISRFPTLPPRRHRTLQVLRRGFQIKGSSAQQSRYLAASAFGGGGRGSRNPQAPAGLSAAGRRGLCSALFTLRRQNLDWGSWVRPAAEEAAFPVPLTVALALACGPPLCLRCTCLPTTKERLEDRKGPRSQPAPHRAARPGSALTELLQNASVPALESLRRGGEELHLLNSILE